MLQKMDEEIKAIKNAQLLSTKKDAQALLIFAKECFVKKHMFAEREAIVSWLPLDAPLPNEPASLHRILNVASSEKNLFTSSCWYFGPFKRPSKCRNGERLLAITEKLLPVDDVPKEEICEVWAEVLQRRPDLGSLLEPCLPSLITPSSAGASLPLVLHFASALLLNQMSGRSEQLPLWFSRFQPPPLPTSPKLGGWLGDEGRYLDRWLLVVHAIKAALDDSYSWRNPYSTTDAINLLLEQDEHLLTFLAAALLVHIKGKSEEMGLKAGELLCECLRRLGWQAEVVLDWLLSEQIALPFLLTLAKTLHYIMPIPDPEPSSSSQATSNSHTGDAVGVCETDEEPCVLVVEEAPSGCENNRTLQAVLCSASNLPPSNPIPSATLIDIDSADTLSPSSKEPSDSERKLIRLLTELRDKLHKCNARQLLSFNAAALIARLSKALTHVQEGFLV